MKFLWVSKYADTLGIALKVQAEGNEVELAIIDPQKRVCGKGMIPIIDDWRSRLSKDKVIVFDMVGSGKIASSLRNQGYKVFGAGEIQDSMELDRTFGSEAMIAAGINVPKTTTLTSFDDAIKLVKKTQQKYVFKPSGNMHAALTYVAYNDEDMIQFLEQQKKVIFKEIEFEMQCVQPGIEVSLEGMFDGNDWVEGWWNYTLERKREANDDLGQNTGCALDCVRAIPEGKDNPMVKKTLLKITPMLREAGYKGLLDINCIYFNGTPFGLEWTCRFGINAIYTLSELLQDDLGQAIYSVAASEPYKAKMRQYLWAASVRTCLAPKPKIPQRLIQNITSFKHIHPMDMMLNEDGQLVTADTDLIIAIVSETGPSISEASTKVYNVLKKTENFGILDLKYRTDCGCAAEKADDGLRKWGLVK